ncbi:hypothetical protein LP420_05275 [Massilia sp. B-10]|nr:hypothetical protein LP420_05275 [Massilia sp. B-10]
MAYIMDGRNTLVAGGTVVGTANSAIASSADVTFLARSLAYGDSPTVTNALGSNSNVAVGGTLPAVNSGNSNQGLTNFLDQDKGTAVVQTGAKQHQRHLGPGQHDRRGRAPVGPVLRAAGLLRLPRVRRRWLPPERG